MEPLDKGQLTALINSLTLAQGFQARDNEWKRMRQLVYCSDERRPTIPGVNLKTTYQSPEIEYDGHAFKKRMLGAGIKISASAQSETEKAENRANKLEGFFYRHDVMWRQTGVYDRALFDMATLGLGVLHLTLDPAALPTVPEPGDESPTEYLKRAKDFLKKQKQTIFRLESADPITIKHNYDWSVVVQDVEVPLHPLQVAYAERGVRIKLVEKEGGDGKKVILETVEAGTDPQLDMRHFNETVRFIAVETNDFIYHLVTYQHYDEAEVLGRYQNPFGRPGFQPVAADNTGDPDPYLRYRPLLLGKYRTVPIKNLLTTALLSAGIEAAQQRYILKPIDQMAAQEDSVQVQITPEGILQPPMGWEIQAAKLDIGIDLTKGLEYLTMIDTFGFPQALIRPEEVTATSGYDRARQQDSVSSLLDPPLSHFAEAQREIFLRMSTAIRELDAPVTIRNVRLATSFSGLPKDVQEEVSIEKADVVDIDLRVTYDSITLFSRIAKQEEDMKMMEKGLLTETEFLGDSRGLDDIPQFRRLRRRDVIRREVDERAVADVLTAIDAIRQGAMANAAQQTTLPDDLKAQLAGERGPSIPVGTGQAIPVVPPAPMQATNNTMAVPGVG